MADLKKLAEDLTKLTVLEVNELKNILKDEYGIEPAAAAAVIAGPAAGGDAAAAWENRAVARHSGPIAFAGESAPGVPVRAALPAGAGGLPPENAAHADGGRGP